MTSPFYALQIYAKGVEMRVGLMRLDVALHFDDTLSS